MRAIGGDKLNERGICVGSGEGVMMGVAATHYTHTHTGSHTTLQPGHTWPHPRHPSLEDGDEVGLHFQWYGSRSIYITADRASNQTPGHEREREREREGSGTHF